MGRLDVTTSAPSAGRGASMAPIGPPRADRACRTDRAGNRLLDGRQAYRPFCPPLSSQTAFTTRRCRLLPLPAPTPRRAAARRPPPLRSLVASISGRRLAALEPRPRRAHSPPSAESGQAPRGIPLPPHGRCVVPGLRATGPKRATVLARGRATIKVSSTVFF